MNKPRRKELTEIYELIASAKERLEIVKDDEQEYRDNMPENLQCGEKAERADEVVYELEDAIDNLERVLDIIDDAQE